MKLNFNNSELIMTAGNEKQFPKGDIPQIAFSGRSNVGKSTLVNTLLGRKKFARTSSSPGKTITVNFYEIDKKLMLVDLPGYGYAKRWIEDKQKWSTLVDGYISNEKKLKLVVQLIDLKVGPSADDDMMLDWLYQTNTPYIIVATKTDKINKTIKEKNLQLLRDYDMTLPNTTVIPFSSLTGEGKDDIWAEIFKAVK